MAKLSSALSAIDAGRRVPACSHLDAFIHEVLVQTGKKIPAVQAVELIAAALPEDKRMMIVELADNHARHVWMQQEGAYLVGLAVGRMLRLRRDA